MMDSLILEMEKLLASYKGDFTIQDIIGEYAEVNIDNLLIEADKLINETKPYFQTISNNKGEIPKDLKSKNFNFTIKTTQSKYQQSDKKRVVFNLKNSPHNVTISKKHFKTSKINGKSATINRCIINKERQNNMFPSYLNTCTTQKFKLPEEYFMKTQLQLNSAILENNNQLHIICNKHDKLTRNNKIQDQICKLNIQAELNYYKSKNNELEKNLILKKEEIHNLEHRYEKLNQYCDSVLKKIIEEKFKNYDFQLNQLIQHNMNKELQLHTIINNLLDEINQSHLQYRIKLTETNKEICKYLDKIEKILNSIYTFKHINAIR